MRWIGGQNSIYCLAQPIRTMSKAELGNKKKNNNNKNVIKSPVLTKL